MDSRASSPAKRSVCIAVAAASFAAFLALGVFVGRFGEPPALWSVDRLLVGRGARVAWWIAHVEGFYVLAALFVVLLIAAAFVKAWRSRIVFSLAMLVLAWRAADLFQHLFARPRRLDWVIFHETSFSYPSSHATIAIAFYALWAWLLAKSAADRSFKLGAIELALLVPAICWSRLALGAHYLTDIAGGILLGIALLAAGAAVWPEILRPQRSEVA
ncbi:MAG: phosphatase PAP2 family protein [Candidatus Tyrphobacter sp.]